MTRSCIWHWPPLPYDTGPPAVHLTSLPIPLARSAYRHQILSWTRTTAPPPCGTQSPVNLTLDGDRGRLLRTAGSRYRGPSASWPPRLLGRRARVYRAPGWILTSGLGFSFKVHHGSWPLISNRFPGFCFGEAKRLGQLADVDLDTYCDWHWRVTGGGAWSFAFASEGAATNV